MRFVMQRESKKSSPAGASETFWDFEILKAKETRTRKLESDEKTNNFWLGAIQKSLMNGTSLDSVTDEQYIDEISSEELQRIANKYFNTGEYLKVVLYPENYKDKVN